MVAADHPPSFLLKYKLFARRESDVMSFRDSSKLLFRALFQKSKGVRVHSLVAIVVAAV